ncbi:hypothetical protein lerEdw1_014411 [Lerista edwardsae]|nr:hypothetical protein lerEdw1_014411 [Lerista edwardsae]
MPQTTGIQLAGVLETVAIALMRRKQMMAGRRQQSPVLMEAVDSAGKESEESTLESEDDVVFPSETSQQSHQQENVGWSLTMRADVRAPLPGDRGGMERAGVETSHRDGRLQGASSRAVPPDGGEQMIMDRRAGGQDPSQAEESMVVEETPSGERPTTLLVGPLAEVFDALLREESPPGENFSRGFLRLLPKEGDSTLITNWCPLTINNVDHHVIARVLLSSPLLYALALDPLLSKIQSEGRIEGIVTQSRRRLKTVAHADDMYVLLRDEGECYFLNPDTPDIICKAMDMGRQGRAAQQKVRSIKILGTHFGLDQEIWEQEWKTWASKVGAKLQKWKDWKLNIFQRVRYFNVCCIPMALGLAIMYPPPRTVIETVTGQFFQFVWGTKFFPLCRMVAYKKIKECGLGAWALGPLFLAMFLAYNFGNWRKWRFNLEEGEEGSRTPIPSEFAWGSFEASWKHTRWAQRWWEASEIEFVVTRQLKLPLPKYLRELASWVKEFRSV